MSQPNPTRRLAAILAADAAGYSRLMQADDAATVAMLEQCRALFRQCIEARLGRVVDMAGDSVLAVFDAATAAVESAMDVQNQLQRHNDALPVDQRMQFRIGIHSGEVIQKDGGAIYGDGVNIAARLQAIVEPGAIAISGVIREQVGNRIVANFESIGEHWVKNISHPVHAYRVSKRAETADIDEVARRPYHVTPQLPEYPAIAVLPFANMSDDAQQEYFSDGITDDVITNLSKLPGLLVIARNSVFTYKGKATDLRQVGRELGVHYVLEGSVRKVSNQVRVTAQLIDATSGFHLWADRYDGELVDIFALQDRITEQIATALVGKLKDRAPARKSRHDTDNIEAYDLALRGIATVRRFSKASNEAARQDFERAIQIDPRYAKAYTHLSWTHYNDWHYQWINNSSGLERAMHCARTAQALDDELPEAHITTGWYSLWNKDHECAIGELERAVALDPNSERANSYLGEVLNFAGRPDDAIKFSMRAMRLDPNYGPHVVFHLAHSYFLLRRYDEAIAAMLDALSRNPNFPPAHRLLAVAYAELGRMQEARAAGEETLRISPDATVEFWRRRFPYRSAEDAQRFLDGLQKAGVP